MSPPDGGTTVTVVDSGLGSSCEHPDCGNKCGFVPDDCGGQDCGGCGDGRMCDSSNQCVVNNSQGGGCREHSCNNRCGRIDDGCGGRKDCGNNCDSGEQCQGTYCRSCEVSCSGRCGDIEDECGNDQHCGDCGPNRVCSQWGWCQPAPDPDDTGWIRLKRAQNHSTGGVNWTVRSGGGADVELVAPTICLDPTRRVSSDALWLNDADLPLPSNVEVRGIEIRIFAKRDGVRPTVDQVSLHSSGAFASGSRARDLNLSTDFRPFTFGGSSDTWGLGSDRLTRSALVDNSFGVRIWMSAVLTCDSENLSNPAIDYAEVRVHYVEQ